MRLFERTYDPFTGIWTTIGAEDDKLVVKYDADVEANLEYSKGLQNDDEYTQRGIKKSWWHAFHIPPIVAMKMMTEDGYNPYNGSAKETFAFLRKNKEKYGHCLTTRKQF